MRPEGSESLRKRASFSKATLRCPASRRGIPRPCQRKAKTQKPPESGGFSEGFDGSKVRGGLKPLRTASAAMVPARPTIPIVTTIPIVIAVATIHATLEATVTPSATAAEPAFYTRQDGKTTFLPVVEGLVERIGRVRDTLHRCRRGNHAVGALAQARHRIAQLLRILLLRIL